MDFQYIFDDKWWMWVWHNFSFVMLLIPSIAATILKLIAIRHPEVPTDTIMELFRKICAKPGEKIGGNQ
ncbi:MAG: hypothetical protein CVU71_03580 [Deltaproteobacteria bacterium HGW-Deltaproteobacteria-6]|jgi:hypothetical protein|nr:MAG: hypothetical protein CVU71_03580 [Deltaproteobacteria bacterium HGW-Deltaproteobacteria-6]